MRPPSVNFDRLCLHGKFVEGRSDLASVKDL